MKTREEDFVNECLEQLDKEIKRLRFALICSFAVIFSGFFIFLM